MNQVNGWFSIAYRLFDYWYQQCIQWIFHTSQRGRQIEHLDAAAAGELAQYHLHVVERATDDEQHYEVWYKEGATAILQRREREPPNVTQANRHSDARHQKFNIVAPFASFLLGGSHLIRIRCDLLRFIGRIE